MSLDRGTSRPPAAAGQEQGEANEDEDEIARRLRVLGSVCAALTVAVVATVAAVGWAAAGAGAGELMASPPVDSFLIAFGAMMLVLLASAVHGRILRRQAAAEVEEREQAVELEVRESEEPPEGGRQRAAVTARLRAYSWATGASFGMLAVAAALGAVVARTGKAPFYGLVICIAAFLSMLARWPRRSGFDLALTPDRPEAVSRAAAWRNLAQPFASHAADGAREDASAGPTAGEASEADEADEAGEAGEAGEGTSGRMATGPVAGGGSEAKVGSGASGAGRGGLDSGPG
jgi:hypothetical protein